MSGPVVVGGWVALLRRFGHCGAGWGRAVIGVEGCRIWVMRDAIVFAAIGGHRRRVAMQEDHFSSALQESEDLLWAAQPDQLQAGIRILACQVAYARRHHDYLPIDAINQWIETGRKDPSRREVVTEGMEKIIAVMGALGVERATKSAI